MAVPDLLNEELKVNDVRITVNKIYQANFQKDLSYLEPRTRTPKIAKYSIRDVYDLFRRAIENYELRANIPDKDKVCFTEEDPDIELIKRYNTIVTVSLVSRVPGAFGQGAPGEAKVRNRSFQPREEFDDEENPGYKLGVVGYWYDSVVRMTTWCKTNKEANKKVDWLEDVMQDYAWWFKSEGVDRVLFNERQSDILKEVDNNKLYGRPLDYFVRTEKIRVVSEKKIESIVIDLTLANQ
jgi:hypothetical protein